MKHDFKIGDLVKVKGENRVFKVEGITKGLRLSPDGFIVGSDNLIHNPKFCEPYIGATSVFDKGEE